MEAITIVNESGATVRVAVFRRPAADGGVALVSRVVEVPGRGRTRLPGEHYALSLLYQLASGYGRSKVVSFPGPPARFAVRQRQPGQSPHLAIVSEDLATGGVRVQNDSGIPVQVFLYREDREIERSSFLDPGEEFACEVRPELCLVAVDSLHPGDELPPDAQDRAMGVRTGQTARIVDLAGDGFKIEIV